MKDPRAFSDDTFEPIRPKRGRRPHRYSIAWCDGKHIHLTYAAAAEKREKILRSGRVDYLRIYRCLGAPHWHLTSRRLYKQR